MVASIRREMLRIGIELPLRRAGRRGAIGARVWRRRRPIRSLHFRLAGSITGVQHDRAVECRQSYGPALRIGADPETRGRFGYPLVNGSSSRASSFTYVPLSCRSIQPCSTAYFMPAPNSGPLPLQPSVEWIIDLFDVNTAVDRFDAGGELDGLSSGRFRISVGTFVDQLHMGFRR
jgi:hypothetical protein